jgi:cytochrome c5
MKISAVAVIAAALAIIGAHTDTVCGEPTVKARSADAILDQYCNVCHSTGWNGAPMNGDRAEWAPRLGTGFDALFKNAKQGFNNMPPMGTCLDCTDEELTAAIRKMLP